MSFTKVLAVLHSATRVCQRITRASATISCAALGELLDIIVRVHGEYELLGTLGVNNVRLRARTYLHLQHCSHYRVLYTSARAMTAFETAVDYMVARLPSSAFEPPRRAFARSRGGAERGPAGSSPAASAKFGSPSTSGCFLCPATDHYCNDARFHAKVNGRYKKMSQADKDAILVRIRNSSKSTAAKAEETRKIRDFWSQHSL